MNHSVISGQEMMALSRNTIEMNKDMQLRLRLDMHSPVNACRTTLNLVLLFKTQKQLSTMA